jgi:Tol biopolymer transport system component
VRPVANAWRVPILRERLATWADAEPISAQEAYIEELDVSPDGTKLVLNSDRAGNLDLCMVPLDGGEWRALTTHVMPDWSPRHSADGTEIVFHSHHEGSRDLFIVPSEGGVIGPLTESPEFELQATYSPDGKRVAYWNRSAGELWVVSTEDGSGAPLNQAPGTHLFPEWSPDG